MSVITEALRRFETTVFAPVKLRGRDCSLACRAKCERGGTADICVGLEAPCMFVQGAMLRAKYFPQGRSHTGVLQNVRGELEGLPYLGPEQQARLHDFA